MEKEYIQQEFMKENPDVKKFDPARMHEIYLKKYAGRK